MFSSHRVWFAVVLVGACVACSAATGGEDDLEVVLRLGRVRGHRLTARKGREMVAFQGIPYARPPVGELRFQPAQPADAWTDVLDATKEAPVCTQADVYFKKQEFIGQEDCLYLNVFTPKVKSTAGLPVMVWIHGGGWFIGSGTTDIYSPGYLLDKDVVLVTFNYRLGPLGFLSTGDAECPGNNGLKDQVAALRWVKENIAQFGGNPGKVTLFGQSAGGASVQYHVLSPLSKGLFHGAIAQSGSALAFWALSSAGTAKSRAERLAVLLDCPITSSAGLLNCLRTKQPIDLIKAESQLKEWNQDPPIVFRPVVEAGEEAFIIDLPVDLLLDPARIATVPYMTGVNSGEGGLSAAEILIKPDLLQQLNDQFDSVAPITLGYGETSPDPDYVTSRVRDFYFHDQPISNDTRFSLVDMYTDCYFLLPVDESVRLQATASAAPVFYYFFDYKPPVSYNRIFRGGDIDLGVSHSDELQVLFPHEKMFPDSQFNETDWKMVDTLVTLWTDFARTGNPTPAGHELEHWTEVKTADVEYMHITRSGEISMRHSLLAQRAHFWASLPLTVHPYTSIRDEL